MKLLPGRRTDGSDLPSEDEGPDRSAPPAPEADEKPDSPYEVVRGRRLRRSRGRSQEPDDPS